MAKSKGGRKRARLKKDRRPVRTVDLFFDAKAARPKIFKDMSAFAIVEDRVYCSCDEHGEIERLTYDPATGEARGHRSVPLDRLFALPESEADEEADIEGMAIGDGHLWICGSHALKRAAIGPGGSLSDLAAPRWDRRRGFLGRVPLQLLDDMMDGQRKGRPPEALMLPMAPSPRTAIRMLLETDPLVGPFLALPSKENGFDIEGLAVRGEDVLLGLRGPVIGGYALVVRLRVREAPTGGLALAPLADGRLYHLQAIPLVGQGIRDLLWDGDRLLLLSGATTLAEAPQSVFAIEGYAPERETFDKSDVARTLDLRLVRGADHAEGMAFLTDDGRARLLVAYDSPRTARTDKTTRRLTCDLFAFD